MTQVTIEDVLNKHWDSLYFTKYESAKRAMQEWASLQTPSNEKYWRERCEAAEYLVSPDAFKMLPEAWRKWRELKSTPIPIQTPCVELEKEVERLKGLCAILYKQNPITNEESWKRYQKQNNL